MSEQSIVDASALLELLLQTPLGTRVEARHFPDQHELHAPHLADVEITQGLRRLVRAGEVSPGPAFGRVLQDPRGRHLATPALGGSEFALMSPTETKLRRHGGDRQADDRGQIAVTVTMVEIDPKVPQGPRMGILLTRGGC